jgi:hypothetical protein
MSSTVFKDSMLSNAAPCNRCNGNMCGGRMV